MKFQALRNFIDPQVEPRPLRALKRIQRLLFMFPRKGERFDKTLTVKHIIFSQILGMPSIIGVCGYMYQAFLAGMVYETFISLYYLSYVVSLLFISINYLLVGNTLWQTIHAIESNKFGKPHTLVEAFKQSNINTWTVFFLTFALDGFLSIFNNKIHDMCELRVQRNDSRFRCGYGYHTAVWYPFKEDYVVLEWLLKLWFSLGEILLISLYISTLITTTGILKFLPIRMQDLRHKLQCITESNIQENITQFEYFARYYIYIVRCINDLNKSLGYCLVAGYICTTLILTMIGYMLLLGRNGEMLALIAWYMFQVWLCNLGQNLENEHEKLVDRICCLPWYALTPKMRKDYQLLLGTLNIPVHVIGQPFVYINHGLLLAVTRTAYSAFTFLASTTE